MIFFQILGAGGAVPTPQRSPAAYWVEVDGRGLLLDPGPGAVVRLLRSGFGPNDIDDIETILLTHLHLDHCADLAPLLFAWHSPLTESQEPITILGPAGLKGYMEQLRGLYGDSITPAKRDTLVREIEPGGTFSLSEGSSEANARTGPRVEAFAADHAQSRADSESLVYRFVDADGHRVVFSGDTGPAAGLSEAARDADLLVVECSCPNDQAVSGHLTPDLVGRLCAEANPARVVLTHLYPPAAALDLPELVAEHFSGPVTKARDGDLFIVPAHVKQDEDET